MKKKLILASSSPRRKEILQKMGLEFKIMTSSYEESFDNLNFTYEKIEEMAYNKAKSIIDTNDFSSIGYCIILSADTVVVLDNKIMCKPKDNYDAVSMLKILSGKKHSIVTSLCAIDTENLCKKILSTTSYIEFNKLSNDLINNYVEVYKPLDKAGAYGIQELPDGFVKEMLGSYENIMGLCPLAVKSILNI